MDEIKPDIDKPIFQPAKRDILGIKPFDKILQNKVRVKQAILNKEDFFGDNLKARRQFAGMFKADEIATDKQGAVAKKIHRRNRNKKSIAERDSFYDLIRDHNELSNQSKGETPHEFQTYMRLRYGRNKKSLLINVEGDFKTSFDLVISGAVLYIMIFLPIKISFQDGRTPLWDIADYFVDFLFLVDLVLTFYTPYYENTILVTDMVMIALRYLRFWFWIDLAAIIPFQLILPSNTVQQWRFLVRSNKLLRSYRLFQVATLFKTFIKKRHGETGISALIIRLLSTNNVLINQLAPIVLYVGILSHFTSCLWHYYSYSAYEGYDSWIDRNSIRDNSASERYVSSLYFIFQTITTVGYGDIGVCTAMEFLFAACMMFAGVIMYSFIFSNLLQYVLNSMNLQDETQSKLELLSSLEEELMLGRDFILETERDIRNWQNDSSQREESIIPKFKGINKEDVFQLFFEAYKEDISGSRFLNYLVDNGSKEFVVEFMKIHQKKSFRKGQVVYWKGEEIGEFYFIISGEVAFFHPKFDIPPKDIPFYKISNDYFGEIEIFSKEYRFRRFTCRALTNTNVFSCNSKEFLSLVKKSDYSISQYFHFSTVTRHQNIEDSFQELSDMINSTKDLLFKEELEMLKKNPLLRLQRIIKSERFRESYIKIYGRGKIPTKLSNTQNMMASYEQEDLLLNYSASEFQKELESVDKDNSTTLSEIISKKHFD